MKNEQQSNLQVVGCLAPALSPKAPVRAIRDGFDKIQSGDLESDGAHEGSGEPPVCGQRLQPLFHQSTALDACGGAHEVGPTTPSQQRFNTGSLFDGSVGGVVVNPSAVAAPRSR